MKQLAPSWAALALLAPAALVVALVVFPFGCGGGGGGGAPSLIPTQGFVEVGFVDSPSSGFQHILLNVVSVRINPSSDPKVSDFDPNWQTIGAPAGIGSQGELQIDLNAVQNQVQLFNTASVAAQQYNQVELVLDPNQPGTVVPNCPQAPATNEGCLSYPFQVLKPTSIRVTAALQVTKHGLAPLVLDLSAKTITPPPSAGGAYTIDPALAAPNFAQFLGKVSGSVSGVPSQGASVSAELTGTGNVIAQARVVNDSYTLELPAQAGGAGTSYDIFVSGGGVSFAAASGIAITRGGSVQQNFTVASASTGKITGTISDNDTPANPIQGATLDLLVPPVNKAGVDCRTVPSDCVVVATANTDDLGNYPLPGSFLHRPPFDQVPLAPVGTYTLEVTAAGFDTALATAPVTSAGATAVCGTPSTSTTNCSFSLNSATISGEVSIDTPPSAGSQVQVLVMAQRAGTNQLENVTMVTIQSGAKTAPYSLKVPSTIPGFDLFAVAQDFFSNAASPFPGHTIAVLSNVPSGATSQNLGPLNCVGHGSLTGSVANPTSGTTVRLIKDNVQLIESQVSAIGGFFSFCAPPDTYTLRRFENGLPQVPSITTTVATPAPTSSPCPSICGFASGNCPGVCNNTPLSSQL